MSWATSYIEKLKRGETVSFRPRGSSMEGKISSGQLVTVEPIYDGESLRFKLSANDIVLCKVRGKQYLHLIKAVSSDSRYQIANNRGKVNGWIGINSIFGVCVSIAD